MKRLLIPFVAAFGLSLGIATGVVIARAPITHTAQAKRDASVVVSRRPNNGPAVAVLASPANTGAPVVLASAHVTAPVGEPSGAPEVHKGELRAPSTPLAVPAQDTLTGRKLAKVFGAMQPRDAARVLEQMDDADVRTILASLNNKQQAAILGTFPTQRAAVIMRATLRNVGADQ